MWGARAMCQHTGSAPALAPETQLLLCAPAVVNADGYGESGQGDQVPPNAKLEVELECVGWNKVGCRCACCCLFHTQLYACYGRLGCIAGFATMHMRLHVVLFPHTAPLATLNFGPAWARSCPLLRPQR